MVHGRVDGPIPEKKLKEFQRSMATAGGGPSSSKAASMGLPKRKAEAPLPATPPPAKAPKRIAKAGVPVEPVTAVGAEAPKRSAKAGSPAEPASTAGAEAPKRAAKAGSPAEPAAAAGADVGAASSGNQGGAKKAPPAEKKPPPPKAPKKKKCTCGCPIHTERCKLFNPGGANAEAPTRKHPGVHLPPRPLPSMVPPPPPALPAPSAKISKWAQIQVASVVKEVCALPRVEQIKAYKNKMRLFHPDKQPAREQAKVTAQSDQQIAEVFMEIKRHYDHAVSVDQRHRSRGRRSPEGPN